MSSTYTLQFGSRSVQLTEEQIDVIFEALEEFRMSIEDEDQILAARDVISAIVQISQE
jgi:flagellar biosynthesis regulator FlbT